MSSAVQIIYPGSDKHHFDLRHDKKTGCIRLVYQRLNGRAYDCIRDSAVHTGYIYCH